MQNWLTDLGTSISEHPWLAPFFALFLPFLEAVVPSLPLTVIVGFSIAACAEVFGSFLGTVIAIVLSIVGSFSGMVLIRWIIVGKFRPKFEKKVADSDFGKQFLDVVNAKTTVGVFLVMANPFFPSSIINYVLSLTHVKTGKYLCLTISSRIVVILFLAFLGSLFNIQDRPFNVVWYVLVYTMVFCLWLLYYKKRSIH